jgi:hypothetical protein
MASADTQGIFVGKICPQGYLHALLEGASRGEALAKLVKETKYGQP